MTPRSDPRVSLKERPDYGDIIKVNVGVGEKQRSFHVHRALITSRSTFFQKAMSGTWKEVMDQAVTLPEDEPELFASYIHCLYTGNLACSLDPTNMGPDDVSEEYCMLCKLYILAEKLQDVKTKNLTLKSLMIGCNENRGNGKRYLPARREIQTIYDGTPPGSMARKMLVFIYTNKAKVQWIDRLFECPQDFIHELLLSVVAQRTPANRRILAADMDNFMEWDGEQKAHG